MAAPEQHQQPDYRQGYRDALGMIMRGLLLVDADTVMLGDLIADLSRYEEQVDAWRQRGTDAPPAWHPTAQELGADESADV
jgi:hypothetical protein